MKVLKIGKDMKALETKKTKCIACGCEFEYEPSDKKYINDRNELISYVYCPNETCKKMIYV
ncbi:hypothetical protein EZS27_003905 [termite gut metagenome]|uniref:TFIIS-type domain-containing protein n=1 Tax=termite gut metagenome TaxID=433724 RepID=A0A5J4SS80_9ZZZZ